MRKIVRVRGFGAVLILAGAWLAGGGSVHAAGITCGVGIANRVTPSTGCEIGGANNDHLGPVVSEYQVNKDGMFGFSNWMFAEKAFESEALAPIGLSLTGTAISGTWSIEDSWPTLGISHLMLVFKGGAAQVPGQYVAYLIENGAVTGTFLTPFKHQSKDQPIGTSHVSVYYRQETTTVPEPASIVLLGLGLAGVASRLRRRES